jgi:hypothetical protein
MSQNVPLFRLSARRVKAAQLVAEDRLSDEQIGAKVGITRRQRGRLFYARNSRRQFTKVHRFSPNC